MLPLTIWMNMPSFYLDELFNDLATSGKVDLQVIFAKDLSADRVKLGWEKTTKTYDCQILTGKFAVLDAIRAAWSQRRRVHIINGIWAEPLLIIALCVLALTGSRFAIYSESPDPNQCQSASRRLLKKAFGHWVAHRAAGLLAVSHFATDFYLRLGFPKSKIYPFGYFRASNIKPSSLERARVAEERNEVVFVGQIIHRKGIDLLLEAMLPLFKEYPNLHLTVIGTGDEESALLERAQAAGCRSHITFEGVLPSNQILLRLALTDMLVLPSRWDGWGLVVNEAFLVGVPVIVSDHCGAADLVQQGVNGYTFTSENVESLRGCLREFLGSSSRRTLLRSAAACTGRAISTDNVGPYLILCMMHMIGTMIERPVPPWTQRDGKLPHRS